MDNAEVGAGGSPGTGDCVLDAAGARAGTEAGDLDASEVVFCSLGTVEEGARCFGSSGTIACLDTVEIDECAMENVESGICCF